MKNISLKAELVKLHISILMLFVILLTIAFASRPDQEKKKGISYNESIPYAKKAAK